MATMRAAFIAEQGHRPRKAEAEQRRLRALDTVRGARRSFPTRSRSMGYRCSSWQPSCSDAAPFPNPRKEG